MDMIYSLNRFFCNIGELYSHHRKLVDTFHEIQREQYPTIRSVTATMFDIILDFREEYREYIPNYPKAAYRIDYQVAKNPLFKAFIDQCIHHPDAHGLDMKNLIKQPMSRLLQYEQFLERILNETPHGHDDRKEIPHVLEVIKALRKEIEPDLANAMVESVFHRKEWRAERIREKKFAEGCRRWRGT